MIYLIVLIPLLILSSILLHEYYVGDVIDHGLYIDVYRKFKRSREYKVTGILTFRDHRWENIIGVKMHNTYEILVRVGILEMGDLVKVEFIKNECLILNGTLTTNDILLKAMDGERLRSDVNGILFPKDNIKFDLAEYRDGLIDTLLK